MEVLYRAAWLGDAGNLVHLLQQNATMLVDIPDDGRQTPLHISSLLGHVPFTEVILNHNPDLAIRLDSNGRIALHLASAEGHIHIVRVLLSAKNESCLKNDKEGRIPLHYAVMRGRNEVVQELIIASPDSLSRGDGKGNSVFHLCVIHNHFETLQTLVKLDYATANITGGGQPPRPPLFTIFDPAGNSILHLAIMLKRFEVLSYLLSFPEIKKIGSMKNKKGLTAYNIMMDKTTSQDDSNICEIKHMMMMLSAHQPPLTSIDDEVLAHENDVRRNMKLSKRIKKFLIKALIWIESFLRSGDEIWLEEMRGNLSLVATVLATISFQALINPPGGFIQQGLISSKDNNNTSSSNELLNCTNLLDNKMYCPGEAIASYDDSNYHNEFSNYLYNVTVSFISSISVSLLLVSGILPLKNKIVIWILSIAMWFALSFLATAYLDALYIITPDYMLDDDMIMNIPRKWFKVWNSLLNMIVMLISLRFTIWTMKTLNRSWMSRHGGLLQRFFAHCFAVLFAFVFSSVLIVGLTFLPSLRLVEGLEQFA